MSRGSVVITGMTVFTAGSVRISYTGRLDDPDVEWGGGFVVEQSERISSTVVALKHRMIADALDYGVTLTPRDITILNEGSSLAMYTMGQFGIVDDPTKALDQTTAFQDMIDSIRADGGGTIGAEPWTVALTSVKWKQGVSLLGSGMGPSNFGGTVFYRRAGTSDDLFQNDPVSLPPTEWWHWAQFENFRMEDDPANTLGCGFEINCRTGEGFVFQKIFAYNFAEHNIAFRRGGTTCFPNRIHTMRARNGAGLLIERTGADTWSCVHADKISGDNNKVALVRVMRAGAAFETFKLTNLKAESKDVDCQPCVVELEGLNTAHVNIGQISATAVGGSSNPVAIVRLAGAQDFARIQIEGPILADTKYTYLIQNLVTPANNVLNDGTTMRMGYRQSVKWKQGTDTSYMLMRL